MNKKISSAKVKESYEQLNIAAMRFTNGNKIWMLHTERSARFG
jgi:hypothetical protein